MILGIFEREEDEEDDDLDRSVQPLTLLALP